MRHFTDTGISTVRIIAATHQDLEKLVAEKLFREDLYFRLNVVPIRIAPLRERRDDISVLVQHFVERFSRELDVPARWPTEAALELLRSQPWPGNVRELENVMKRALVLSSSQVITPEDIQSATGLDAPVSDQWTEVARREFGEALDQLDADEAGPYWSFVERLERSLITEALQRCNGNQIRAARRLGINRNTLRKKMTDLGIHGVGKAD